MSVKNNNDIGQKRQAYHTAYADSNSADTRNNAGVAAVNISFNQHGLGVSPTIKLDKNHSLSIKGKATGMSNNGRCSHSDCDRPIYKNETCKHHFCIAVRSSLKKALRDLYRAPEKAYASMDFYGRGYITEEDMLNSIVMKRIPFSREDVRDYFKLFNLFSSHQVSTIKIEKLQNDNSSHNGKAASALGNINTTSAPGMTLDVFKKTFFPQLFLINEDDESDNEQEVRKNKEDLKKNKDNQTEIITQRLKTLEKILKNKFQNNWESVRKAFLALDNDYDGYITVEDILRHFGHEKGVVYNDLKKLIMDKDSKKIGKIGYTDFSKWVGNTIHLSEGFYFRHDSIKNPQYEQNLIRQEAKKTDISRKKAQECLINQNLEKTVLDKIKFQWKTLRKAFMDLNMEKSGQIMPEELKFYFEHWGLTLTDEQFQYLFDKFDMDKDGKISYKDFQLTVGSEIHPAEGLYFRQDKPSLQKVESCKHDKCWQPIQGQNHYCLLHQKVHQDECLKIFQRFFKHINTKWNKFIHCIKEAAEPDDTNQIFIDKFIEVLKRFKIILNEKEKEHLLDSFPGRDEGSKKRINIARLYDQRYNMMLSSLYQKVDVHDNDGEDDPVDQSGYTGQFYRPLNKQLVPITEPELVQIINKSNKLIEIIRTIKEIDKQHNGFITTTELDDILKLNYKEQLQNRDLKQIMKKYVSIQNRVLLDYKAFRDSIVAQLKKINETYTYAGTESSLSPHKTIGTSEAQQVSSTNKKQQKGVYEALNKFIAQKLEQQAKEKDEAVNEAKNGVSIKHQFSSRNDKKDKLFAVRTLIRPKTRDAILVSSRKKYLKQDLNQTLNYNTNSLLDVSLDQNEITLPLNNDAYQDRKQLQNLGQKKLSTTLDNFRAHGTAMAGGPAGLNDSLNDDSREDLLNGNISVDLRRAQSSHGHFCQLQRYTGNNQSQNAINNILNLRKRRNIKTSAGGSNFRHLSLNNSRPYIDNANTLAIIKRNDTGLQQLQDGQLQPYYSASVERTGETSSPIKIKQMLNEGKTDQTTNSLMYQTVSSSSQQVSMLKFKQILKTKLQYEWKNIYRLLSVQDKQSNGTVSLSDFEQAIHQCGAFLTKEDIKRLSKLYKVDEQTINYQNLSLDLGMHSKSFTFLKSQHSRQQQLQRLRNLYSSSEKKKPYISISSALTKQTEQSSTKAENNNVAALGDSAIHNKEEVKDILLKKVKQFKELIGIYQRKNHQENPILPLGEFKAVLKGVGINLPNQALQKFIVTNSKQQSNAQANGQTQSEDQKKRRAQSSHSNSFYGQAGVEGLGVDAREFLRFYI